TGAVCNHARIGDSQQGDGRAVRRSGYPLLWNRAVSGGRVSARELYSLHSLPRLLGQETVPRRNRPEDHGHRTGAHRRAADWPDPPRISEPDWRPDAGQRPDRYRSVEPVSPAAHDFDEYAGEAIYRRPRPQGALDGN